VEGAQRDDKAATSTIARSLVVFLHRERNGGRREDRLEGRQEMKGEEDTRSRSRCVLVGQDSQDCGRCGVSGVG